MVPSAERKSRGSTGGHDDDDDKDDHDASGETTAASSSIATPPAASSTVKLSSLMSSTSIDDIEAPPPVPPAVGGGGGVADDDDNIPSNAAVFEDYVPPLPRPIPPPAKYKLWLMVLFCVYFADWFSFEAGVLPAFQSKLRLSFNGAMLLLLIIIVGTLVFGTFDLLVFVLTIKIGDQAYGLGPWLKQPRIKWVHQYTNCFAVFLATIVVILEEGFALFNVPEPEKPTKCKQFDTTTTGGGGGVDADEEYAEVVLKIEHHIKPDKQKEFNAWKKRINHMGCTSRPGMKEVRQQCQEGGVHVTYIHFTSVDYLNDYMQSPIRDRTMKMLQPLLDAPSIVQMRKERTLPDCFTDLCNAQSQPVPQQLPKKWKVWTITTMALWIMIIVTSGQLPHYYEQWGVTQAHDRVQAFVRILLATFLDTYVGIPFLTMLFGSWLARDKKVVHVTDRLEPWRTLNDGFTSVWSQLAVTLAFYGGCAIAWIIRATTATSSR